jgi:hypothetical protein
MNALLDQDIAHVAPVIRPSLRGDSGGPGLPAEYWRKRLFRMLKSVT